MLWRAPWLRHRLGLLIFAAWDALSLYISYNLTYLTRLGRWEGLSPGLGVVTIGWLSASYVIGRYSPAENGDRKGLAKELGLTLAAGSAVVAIFVGHSWVYQVTDAQTRFRGFLIPLVLSACLLSMVGIVVQSQISEQKRQWLLFGNEKERETISRELKSEKRELQLRTLWTTTEQLSRHIAGACGTRIGLGVGVCQGEKTDVTDSLLELREKGQQVIPLLNWCEQELQRIPPELVHREWLIQAEGFTLRPGSTSWRIKRCGDLLGASVLTVLTSPLVALAIILIWLEDRGPAFYGQTRSGLYGKPIRIWKLRSMRTNAEQSGPQWAKKADPRVTRVGKVLRATRIDELPQLLSVISGDLSLIGPRPERPEIEEELEILIPNYRIRHWIRPGLSGWAQVCYPYVASLDDSRAKLSYDLYYIRNASLLLDVLITMKTIRLVTRAQGAAPKEEKQNKA